MATIAYHPDGQIILQMKNNSAKILSKQKRKIVKFSARFVVYSKTRNLWGLWGLIGINEGKSFFRLNNAMQCWVSRRI